MAPWDAWRARRYQTRAQRLPTRIASAQPLDHAPHVLLQGGTTRQPWQIKARYYGRTLGVVRFSAGVMASAVSRCPMTVEKLVDPVNNRWEPDDDPVATAVLQTYRNERDDQTELVRRHAWHYQISGEAIGTVEQTRAGAVAWYVYGPDACLIYPYQPVLVRDIPGGSVFNGGAREVPQDQVTRFWIPDEDWPLLATSPMAGIVEDCDRYSLLGRRTKREAQSALGMNGVLWTQESAHHYSVNPETGQKNPHSDLDRDMAAVSRKAWDEEESAAATTPFSMHYGIDKDTVPPQWIDIGKTLDPKVLEARLEALECIARGLPLPNAIVLHGAAGADANHWNAFQIEETFFKGSVAPLADQVFHSDLTKAMLRPSLARLAQAGLWAGDPSTRRVGYDPTAVIIHPDKAAKAVELYKLGALDRLTVLLENGFGPEDAPSDAELEQFVKTQQALRANTRVQATEEPTAGDPSAVTPLVRPTDTQRAPVGVGASLSPYPNELDGWIDG